MCEHDSFLHKITVVIDVIVSFFFVIISFVSCQSNTCLYFMPLHLYSMHVSRNSIFYGSKDHLYPLFMYALCAIMLWNSSTIWNWPRSINKHNCKMFNPESCIDELWNHLYWWAFIFMGWLQKTISWRFKFIDH